MRLSTLELTKAAVSSLDPVSASSVPPIVGRSRIGPCHNLYCSSFAVVNLRTLGSVWLCMAL